MENLKIALLKQDVYQDLYVCPVTEKSAANILFSSMMRVGPIGLMSDLNADFYIVKEEPAPETQIYKKVIPHIVKMLPLLKTRPLNQVPGYERWKVGTTHANGDFAVDCHDVDWGRYDVVISINVSLPTDVVMKYPQTLFAYMIGEANMATKKARFGYDITLNQMARGIVADRLGEVDFPYTFVGADTLERIIRSVVQRPSKRNGVHVEVNSVAKNRDKVPPQFLPIQEAGYEIHLHQGLISDNLTSIYDSKYFVKIGGRPIRGNSVAEAVSLGTLAIMNRSEVTHGELIIDECNVGSTEEVLALLKRLDADDELYNRLLEKQRAVLQHLFFEAPVESLRRCVEMKRAASAPKRYTPWNKMSDRLFLFYRDVYNFLKKVKRQILSHK